MKPETAALIGLAAALGALPNKPESKHEFGEDYKKLQADKKRRKAEKRERRLNKLKDTP